MSLNLRRFLLGPFLLLHAGTVRAQVQPDFLAEFSTARCHIAMRVSFPPPYEGKPLVVYHSADPRTGDCLSLELGTEGCVDNFVGALAVVLFKVSRVAGLKPAAASIREVVTVVDQSPGLPDRPPFVKSIKLVDGAGSDLQVFGYDESPAPPAERPAEREAAKAHWRRYRQNLYMDKDPQPFAVVYWLHTTTRIRILRVEAPTSSGTKSGR